MRREDLECLFQSLDTELMKVLQDIQLWSGLHADHLTVSLANRRWRSFFTRGRGCRRPSQSKKKLIPLFIAKCFVVPLLCPCSIAFDSLWSQCYCLCRPFLLIASIVNEMSTFLTLKSVYNHLLLSIPTSHHKHNQHTNHALHQQTLQLLPRVRSLLRRRRHRFRLLLRRLRGRERHFRSHSFWSVHPDSVYLSYVWTPYGLLGWVLGLRCLYDWEREFGLG